MNDGDVNTIGVPKRLVFGEMWVVLEIVRPFLVCVEVCEGKIVDVVGGSAFTYMSNSEVFFAFMVMVLDGGGLS